MGPQIPAATIQMVGRGNERERSRVMQPGAAG